MATENNTRSDCPICISLDIFGDKWSFLIIRDMMIYNKNTYGDFLKMEENIATNILADRLVTLEKASIITKEVFAGSKSKFFYKLTQKGIDLLPVAIELINWGGRYYDIKPQLKAVIKEVAKNKDGFIKHLSINLKKVKAIKNSDTN